MANNVGANGQSVVTKKSGGKVMTGPDVCKTPIGSSLVPIPYPNISQSSDLAKGSKSVQVNGAPVCLKGSSFRKSSGDQAGTSGGVISGKTGAQADPLTYSFDVKIEGKNVVRNFDSFQSNARNTPPGPVMQAPVVPGAPASAPAEAPKCRYCKKEQHKFASSLGDHLGNSQKLRRRIISDIKDHRWYAGPRSLEAHHIIPSQVMADDHDWPTLAVDFGYDINHKHNGVMLPYTMALACHLHVPMHRSNHSNTGDGGSDPYPVRVSEEISDLKREAKKGEFCTDPHALREELDALSKSFLARISRFEMTLTADGKDYQAGGNGCSGVRSITNKPAHPCPHDRAHGITHAVRGTPINRNTTPLEVGR